MMGVTGFSLSRNLSVLLGLLDFVLDIIFELTEDSFEEAISFLFPLENNTDIGTSEITIGAEKRRAVLLLLVPKPG